jgi:hypothetical protein
MKRLLLVLVLLSPVLASADVVLTLPEEIRSELGATTTVQYDRIRTLGISVDPQAETVRVQFELFVSSDNSKPAL